MAQTMPAPRYLASSTSRPAPECRDKNCAVCNPDAPFIDELPGTLAQRLQRRLAS